MDITNKTLDIIPINCGNCLQMKVAGKRKGLLIAKCFFGWLDNKSFIIDSPVNNQLPSAWRRAELCDDFNSMIENTEDTEKEDFKTWEQVINKHIK